MPKAEAQLQPVLLKQPTYIDARLGLINIQLAKRNNKEALSLINEGLKINPNISQLLTLKAIANKEPAAPLSH